MASLQEFERERKVRLFVEPERKPVEVVPLGGGVDGFLIYNLFSRNECEHYVRQSEDAGYLSLDRLYSKSYRNNTRVIVVSEDLAELIWSRVSHCFQARVYEKNRHAIVPGTYEPRGVNPCFRFCKYNEGGHFSPHEDGTYIRDDAERSLMTLMIYLNDGFRQGETEFLEGRGILERVKVQPVAGMALCFFHFQRHEGKPVLGENKYICRTDIMYELTDKGEGSDDKSAAMELLHLAEYYEQARNTRKAVECYKKAYKLCPELEFQ